MIVGHHLGRPKKKFLEKIVFAGPHLYIIYYVHTRGGPSPTRYETRDTGLTLPLRAYSWEIA